MRKLEISIYSLSGGLVKRAEVTADSFDFNLLGEKVRVKTADGTEVEGFWDTAISTQGLPAKVKIGRYDLDEATGTLQSGREIFTFIQSAKIVKIEAILHSNPRWGGKVTNRFEFSEPVRLKVKPDLFKSNSGGSE